MTATATRAVSVDAKDLEAALSAVASTAAGRSPLSILTHIHIVADDGRLRLEAGDGEAFVSRTIQADGEMNACLPAKTLLSASKAIQGNGAIFEPGASGVVLRSGRSVFKIPSLDGIDFPVFPAWEGEADPIAVAREDFAGLMAGPLLAVSTEKYRPVLQCVALSRDGDDLIAAATDTHRLHVSRVQAAGSNIEGLVPAPFARAVASLPSASVEIRTTSRGIWAARCEAAEATHQVFAGTYPNWERVIPSDAPPRAVVPRLLFIDALRRVLSTVQPIRVVLDTDAEGGVAILGRDEERGEAEDFVSGESQMGGGRIAFNPKYLIDAFSSLKGDDVTIHFAEYSRPTKFTGDGPDLAVILPMALV